MGTLIVGAVVLGAVALAVRKIYKDRKNGKGCSCDCNSCSKGCRSNDNMHA